MRANLLVGVTDTKGCWLRISIILEKNQSIEDMRNFTMGMGYMFQELPIDLWLIYFFLTDCKQSLKLG